MTDQDVAELGWELLTDDPDAVVDALLGLDGPRCHGRAARARARIRRRPAHRRGSTPRTTSATGTPSTTRSRRPTACTRRCERNPTPELLRGLVHGALRVYLDRFLNVPAARPPSVHTGIARRARGVLGDPGWGRTRPARSPTATSGQGGDPAAADRGARARAAARRRRVPLVPGARGRRAPVPCLARGLGGGRARSSRGWRGSWRRTRRPAGSSSRVVDIAGPTPARRGALRRPDELHVEPRRGGAQRGLDLLGRVGPGEQEAEVAVALGERARPRDPAARDLEPDDTGDGARRVAGRGPPRGRPALGMGSIITPDADVSRASPSMGRPSACRRITLLEADAGAEAQRARAQSRRSSAPRLRSPRRGRRRPVARRAPGPRASPMRGRAVGDDARDALQRRRGEARRRHVDRLLEVRADERVGLVEEREDSSVPARRSPSTATSTPGTYSSTSSRPPPAMCAMRRPRRSPRRGVVGADHAATGRTARPASPRTGSRRRRHAFGIVERPRTAVGARRRAPSAVAHRPPCRASPRPPRVGCGGDPRRSPARGGDEHALVVDGDDGVERRTSCRARRSAVRRGAGIVERHDQRPDRPCRRRAPGALRIRPPPRRRAAVAAAMKSAAR